MKRACVRTLPPSLTIKSAESIKMNYSQIRPSAAAGEFVEFYWILEDMSPPSGSQTIIPDGRAGIILNFANPFESQKNGIWQPQPACFFIGQITGPLLLRPAGPSRMLGIQFRPHGAQRLLKSPMWELTDRAIDLDGLSHRLFQQLASARDLCSLTQAVAAVDSSLGVLASRRNVEVDAIAYAVSSLKRSNGLASIESIADRIGWSTRQLQRRFKDSTGISPKLFGRMQRFQGVLRATEDSNCDWAETAMHCGYYDQAHLIRDFREFSGKTPTTLLDQEIDLTRRFVLAPTMSHFSKTLANGPR